MYSRRLRTGRPTPSVLPPLSILRQRDLIDSCTTSPGSTAGAVDAAVVGGPAIRFDAATNLTKVYTRAFAQPIDFTNKRLELEVMGINRSATNSVTILVSSDGFATTSIGGFIQPVNAENAWNASGQWQTVTFAMNTNQTAPGGNYQAIFTTPANPPDFTKITHWRISIRDIYGDSLPLTQVWVRAVNAIELPPEPIISFHFDRHTVDTVYNTAVPILQAKNWPATMMLRVMALQSGGYSITVPQALDLKNNWGWDYGYYEYSSYLENANNYQNYTTRSQAQAEQLISDGIAQMDAWGLLTNGIRICAGQDRKLSDSFGLALLKQYFDYVNVPCSLESSAYWPADNGMRAITRYVLGGEPVAQVYASIDRAVANKEWMVLKFHDITDSGTGIPTPIADFQAIVDYVASKNVRVMSTSAVLSLGGTGYMPVS